MSSRLSSDTIKAEAYDLGFFACGIAKAECVNDDYAAHFKRWLSLKGFADMDYMSRNTDKWLDPNLLMDGLKSIVCVALNYSPAQTLPKEELQFAAYSLGNDYHDIVKEKLNRLASKLKLTHYRALCDTAPILERYWAMRAGLGWIGRNHQIIIPNAGSMFFLGELLIDEEVEYDEPMKSKCGNCCACIDACPTGVLGRKDGESEDKTSENVGLFDSSRCLSYLTIENRKDIPEGFASKMGNTVYGCDRCQTACPWNRFATPTKEKSLQPKDELLQMTREKWQSLTVEDYRRLFKGSAVKRAKYDGLMRNIRAVLKHEEP